MSGVETFPMLLSPVEIAGLKLKNRIVMPPMNTAMEVGSEQFRAWYVARARGGIGLMIMEAIWVDRLLQDDYCALLEPTVAEVKAEGVPIVLQLFQPEEAPTGGRFGPTHTSEARAATEEELAAIPGRFAEAARRCRQVGFDGVEPHGAHGFFLNRMFSPLANRREGRYGGSLEKRMALGLEIVRAIRAEVGPGYPIFYRHTAEEPGGYTVGDSVVFLRELMAAGVDVMDISPSRRGSGPWDIAAEIKEQVSAPVIAVGGMQDAAAAEAALQVGQCDLCAVGRQLIADSDWPLKIAQGRSGEIISCTQCDIYCFGNLFEGVPIGCAENPRSGNEYKLL